MTDQPPPPPVPEVDPDKDLKMWATITHISALAGYVVSVPFAGILGPLVVWLIKKDEFPQLESHYKAAMNFQISVSIYLLLCIPLVFLFIGVFLAIGVAIFDIVCVIQAAIRANKGEGYTYPLAINFVK